MENATTNATQIGGLEALLQPIGVALDPVFSPLTIFPPYLTIAIISIALTLVIMGVSRLVVNRKAMMAIKEQMEEIKERLNSAQKGNNKPEQDKQLNELLKVNGQYMRHTMKIMMVSIVIVMVFFPWLTHEYHGQKVVNLPFSLPYLGAELDWFWWYFFSAFAVGTIIRKAIGSDI